MTRKTNSYKGQKYIYYRCPTGKAHGCSRPAQIREDELIRCVLACLQAHIKSVITLEELLRDISEERINHSLVQEYQAQIAENEAQLSQINSFQSTLYENFVNGIIDKDEHRALKRHYSAQSEQLREAVSLLQQKLEQALDNTGERQKWVQQFKEFQDLAGLDRRAVVTLIQSIRITSRTELKICFRFQDEYNDALKLLPACKEAV